MAILGLTHDARGTARSRDSLLRSRFAIGEKIAQETEIPPTLRGWITFVFQTPKPKTVGSILVPARTSQVFLRPARGRSELSLTSNDIDDVLKTESAWWSALRISLPWEVGANSGCRWRAVRDAGVRRTQRHPGGERWPGKYRYAGGRGRPSKVNRYHLAAENCPEFRIKKCKYSG